MGNTGDHSFGTTRKRRLVKIVISKGGEVWFRAQGLFNLPINPKIPVVKRRRKQKIPRITTVKSQGNGTEDPVQRGKKKRLRRSAEERLSYRARFRGRCSINSRP